MDSRIYSQDALRNYEEAARVILQKKIYSIWHYVLVCVYVAVVYSKQYNLKDKFVA
jgi:hypothetical protein